MAAGTAGKQTLHTQPALIALGNVVHFLPHHTRPFRRSHLLLLALSVVIVLVTLVELTVVLTRHSLNPRDLFSRAATPAALQTTSNVRSSNGFNFRFNNQQFTATVRGGGLNGPASDTELSKNSALTNVVLTPLPSYVPAAEAAAQLEVGIEPDLAAFATFKAAAPPKTDITGITADYFAPKPTEIATISEEHRTTDAINGVLMTKTTYLVTPTFAGKPTRTIVWTAQLKGRPTFIIIRGIVAGSDVPSSMQPILASLQLESDSKVEGISTLFNKPAPVPIVDQKYAADMVSPAVVKIYHIVCGSLVFNDTVLSGDVCSGSTGSGFLVSGDGYIATNGHVVVYGAKDMLVNQILSDSALLRAFLKGTKLTTAQIEQVVSRPDLTAGVVAGVYDIPDSQLRLLNQREVSIVALGTTPLDIKDSDGLRRLVGHFESTSSLKQATVVGYDYAAKDKLTVLSDPSKGFSASDVALLKISVEGAPYVHLSQSTVTQNQKLTLFGFPSDADNALTDNSSLGVTVTNGSISSIREAAGGLGRLYQSDADASQGNSGGPAVDENGKAFGLLTYRFSSGDSANAAKSYIRDIADFTKLVQSKHIALNTASTTQDEWQRGLDAYSRQHYSAALASFEQVARDYPAHRLAGAYIDLSKQAIRDGKDVQEPSLLLLVSIAAAGLGGLGLASVLIMRQHGFYKLYRAFHQHNLTVQTH